MYFEQNNISREAQTMVLVDHPNVLRSHCSFVSDHNLWVVMPYMAGGSCLHILKAAHPDGFEEVVIATVLREILKGLEYLHHHGHIHRDVKVSNSFEDILLVLQAWHILLSSSKLAPVFSSKFGVLLYEELFNYFHPFVNILHEAIYLVMPA